MFPFQIYKPGRMERWRKQTDDEHRHRHGGVGGDGGGDVDGGVGGDVGGDGGGDGDTGMMMFSSSSIEPLQLSMGFV